MSGGAEAMCYCKTFQRHSLVDSVLRVHRCAGLGECRCSGMCSDVRPYGTTGGVECSCFSFVNAALDGANCQRREVF
jgi:hypothetical protein